MNAAAATEEMFESDDEYPDPPSQHRHTPITMSEYNIIPITAAATVSDMYCYISETDEEDSNDDDDEEEYPDNNNTNSMVRYSDECNICYTKQSDIAEYVLFKCGEGHWCCIPCANRMIVHFTPKQDCINCFMCRVIVHTMTGLSAHSNSVNRSAPNWGVMVTNIKLLRVEFSSSFDSDQEVLTSTFDSDFLLAFFPHLVDARKPLCAKNKLVKFSNENQQLIQQLYETSTSEPKYLYATSHMKSVTTLKYPVMRFEFNFKLMRMCLGASSFELVPNIDRPIESLAGYKTR